MFLILLLLNGLSAFASEQDLYFHLHQAYEYLEASKKGQCRPANAEIKKHLVRADAELAKSRSAKTTSAFAADLRELWRVFNQKEQTSLAEIERVRASVQGKADTFRLKHLSHWHDEIKSCSFGL